MISVAHVSGGYNQQNVLHDISFNIETGELFGIIGPNGSGKTTLLKMLSNILPVSSGNIHIKGKKVSAYSTKALAQLVAVLPQHTMQTFSYTVRETVSLGRYAHQRGIFQSFSQTDEDMIQHVMRQTGIDQYEHEPIDNLSGGERQRVFLAQALAQDPKILLLDEPTNHLDLAYQKELLDVLKEWTQVKDLTVVSIFHDLNLASLYCDRLLLLHKGKTEICGHPDDVLKKSRIEHVYGAHIENHPHPTVAKPQMMLVPNKLHIDKIIINDELLHISPNQITLQSPIPLKTMSSGITGSGVGWHRSFVNRRVDENYECANHQAEMESYLRKNEFHPNDTVGMMTAVELEDASSHYFEEADLSLLIVVTAGVGNAIDASLGKKTRTGHVGTINTWVFVNGELSDEAFIQSVTTATEAKVKALHDLRIKDQDSNSFATGTSTDSILIAATQQGKLHRYGGTVTPLGRLVGKGVYKCTKEALLKYFTRKRSNK